MLRNFRATQLSRYGKIPEYFHKHLDGVSSFAARALIPALKLDSATGYPISSSPNSLVTKVQEWRVKYTDKVLLFRCGDFYEAVGIDALMLIEFAGLNPMGGKCRAGCPVVNIQQTLNAMTSSGFDVAVFEEMSDVKDRSARKNRYLSQVVTPYYPVYIYGGGGRATKGESTRIGESPAQEGFVNELRDDTYFDGKPFVGIKRTADGCIRLVLFFPGSKRVRVLNDLTEEGLWAHIESLGGFADRVFLADQSGSSGDLVRSFSGSSSCVKVTRVPASVSVKALLDSVVSGACKALCIDRESLGKNLDAFIEGSDEASGSMPRPVAGLRPIQKSTAATVGLYAFNDVPPLHTSALPKDSPAHCFHYMRKLLLVPPPHRVAVEISRALTALADVTDRAVPAFRTVSSEQMIRVLESRSPSPFALGKLRDSLNDFVESGKVPGLDSSLSAVVMHDLGIPADSRYEMSGVSNAVSPSKLTLNTMVRGAMDSMEIIDSVLADASTEASSTALAGQSNSQPTIGDAVSSLDSHVRGRISGFKINDLQALNNYEAALFRLTDLVGTLASDSEASVSAKDSNSVKSKSAKKGYVLKYDGVQQALYTHKAFTSSEASATKLVPATDVDGKHTSKLFLLQDYEEAVRDVVFAGLELFGSVKRDVEQCCQALLERHKACIVFAAHWNIVCSTLCNHLISSHRKGWTESGVGEALPSAQNISASAQNITTSAKNITTSAVNTFPSALAADSRAMDLKSVFPYWMTPAPSGVANPWDVTLGPSDNVVLTAPNMAGKSTLLRSITASVLLANCGLYVPCARPSTIPFFSSLIVISPSGDRPGEGLSAFAAEAQAVSCALKEINELSRGHKLEMDDELETDGEKTVAIVKSSSTVDSSPLSGSSQPTGSYRQLLITDEFGRGTSAIDATALSLAVIHSLRNTRNLSFVWTSHLHEIFDPQHAEFLGSPKLWQVTSGTHRLLDGRCRDSEGVGVATEFGLPKNVADTAREIKLNITRAKMSEEANQAKVQEVTPSQASSQAVSRNAECSASSQTKSSANDTRLRSAPHSLPTEGKTGSTSSLVQTVLSEYSAELKMKLLVMENTAAFTLPPSIMSRPVVYVLTVGDAYYVGQTENFKERLAAHRVAQPAPITTVFCIPVSSKSAGLSLESAIIKRLMELEVRLLSLKDSVRTTPCMSRLESAV